MIEIPASLEQYRTEILAGMARANQRRAELANAWSHSTRRAAHGPMMLAGLLEPVGKPQLEKTARPVVQNTQLVATDLQLVKLWPQMGISAMRTGHGGALRLFVLAKNLDQAGRGAIPLADLKTQMHDLKIFPRTYRRWMRDAIELGILFIAGSRIVLAGNGKAAYAFGCDSVGRPVTVQVSDLVSDQWRANVWGAYEQTFQARPVSRDMLYRLSGVPQSTQRNLDHKAGVIRHLNISPANLKHDHLVGLLENSSAPYFEFTDRQGRKRLYRRLPDSRDFGQVAENLSKGRSKKINGQIAILEARYGNGSLLLERASSCDIPSGAAFVRLFNFSPAQAKATERVITRLDLRPAAIPQEIYIRKRQKTKVDLWEKIPLSRNTII